MTVSNATVYHCLHAYIVPSAFDPRSIKKLKGTRSSLLIFHLPGAACFFMDFSFSGS